jgi:hypothetical protein
MPEKLNNEIVLLQEINQKLSMLIALTAVHGKERDDKIKTLASLDFTNAEISKLLGIPKGTVDGIRARKKGAV